MNVAEFIETRRDQHLSELNEFLRIPSVSAKSEHKPDIERASKWVAEKLQAAGFKTVEIVPTSLHPLVYAESLEAPGKPTILFTATTTCSRLSLWNCGLLRRLSLRCATAICLGAARPMTKAKCTFT